MEEIEPCIECAPLVGSLTVGNELDDLVRYTVLAYIKVRSFLSQCFFVPYHLVVQHVERKVNVASSVRLEAAWGKLLRPQWVENSNVCWP